MTGISNASNTLTDSKLYKRLLPYLLILWVGVIYALYFYQFREVAQEVVDILFGKVSSII